MVPESECAASGMSLQFVAEPLFLLRSHADLNIAIQRDYAPTPELHGVVSVAGLTRGPAPVGVVRSGVRRLVLVVAGCRERSVLEQAPGRAVALVELLLAAILVSQITRSEHRAWDFLDQG